MTPAVSVIIPVYERPDQIVTAIGSVLEQTFSDFELIIVDDGSGPAVKAAVSSIDDSRIRMVRHETCCGAAAARNTGIQVARAALVAFLDSDDEWMPCKLDVQVAFLIAAPECRACVSAFFVRPKGGHADRLHVPAARRNIDDLLTVCDLSPGATLLADRSLFDDAGCFDPGFKRFEDWDWLFRCLDYSPVLTVPEPLARIHVGKWPEAAIVRQASGQLLDRHRERIRRLGLGSYLRFRSSLYYEIAAAAFKQGSPIVAGFYLSLSLILCPLAPRGLWRRLFCRKTG